MLYAPKLEFFARIYNFPFDPERAAYSLADGDYYIKYLLKLGCTIPGYCGKFNGKDPCVDYYCIYYHLCEWCAAANHIGNDCVYRPRIALRKKNAKKQKNQANRNQRN